MRVYKYGTFFKRLFPKRVWSRPTNDKVIYLTFDDGPIPEVTPYVLSELEKVNATATFFVVGDNVKKYPEIYRKVIAKGHRVGNHTMNHLKGTMVDDSVYLNNIRKCQELISKDNEPMLFRPPYGRMTRQQQNSLAHTTIVMWSVLTYDFDASLSKEACLIKAIKNTKNGSIVLMHDSLKTIDKLKFVLPRYLNHFTQKGFQFVCL